MLIKATQFQDEEISYYRQKYFNPEKEGEDVLVQYKSPLETIPETPIDK